MCSVHTLQRHGIIGVPTDYRTHRNGTRYGKEPESEQERGSFGLFFFFVLFSCIVTTFYFVSLFD